MLFIDEEFEQKLKMNQVDDVLLASQLISTQTTHSPERALMQAVFFRGICDVFDELHGRGDEDTQDSLTWFLDTSDKNLYSFEHICHTLGYDPDYIRNLVQTQTKNKTTRGIRRMLLT